MIFSGKRWKCTIFGFMTPLRSNTLRKVGFLIFSSAHGRRRLDRGAGGELSTTCWFET
jgi:hypothetical protein